MTSSDRILALASEHPRHENLIYLAALSIMWLEPQNPEARRILTVYRDSKNDIAALRETALQLSILAGFQSAIEACFQIQEVFGDGLPAHDDELKNLNAANWFERGQQLQSNVYRGNVEKLRKNLDGISPELGVWTVLVGYGMVLSRPGLPGHWRELFEAVVLAVQGFPRQLHSHLRGALNTGATPDEVELILRVAEVFMSEVAARSAWQTWRRIRGE